jgi:hypothetical protein
VRYLLRIQNEKSLDLHPFKGVIFKNWLIYEYRVEEPPFYLWRDQYGLEIDLVIDRGICLDKSQP